VNCVTLLLCNVRYYTLYNFSVRLNSVIFACILFKGLCRSFKQLCVYIENIHLKVYYKGLYFNL